MNKNTHKSIHDNNVNNISLFWTQVVKAIASNWHYERNLVPHADENYSAMDPCKHSLMITTLL